MRRPPWQPDADPLVAAKQKQVRRQQIRAAFKRRRDAGLRRRHNRKINHSHKETPQ